ncbi:hypothetical protein [Christiangramia aquimixticola]|uniref:hypothetical protein n=1 Tax=Christiangramia aquimixticola TaxID=1697558 RepID=UPI003AA7CC8D
MNGITTPEILNDLKNLISYSIINKNIETANFQLLHKELVKRYFDARKVSINYEDHSIDLQLPVGDNKYTNITFECQDLERFLKSCLKKDEESLFFYQNLLSQYNVVSAA